MRFFSGVAVVILIKGFFVTLVFTTTDFEIGCKLALQLYMCIL